MTDYTEAPHLNTGETWRRAIRTLLQLIAGGALYGLTEQIAMDIPTEYAPYLMIGYTFLVAFLQNVLEDSGRVPALMKPDTVPTIEANQRIANAQLGQDARPFPSKD